MSNSKDFSIYIGQLCKIKANNGFYFVINEISDFNNNLIVLLHEFQLLLLGVIQIDDCISIHRVLKYDPKNVY